MGGSSRTVLAALGLGDGDASVLERATTFARGEGRKLVLFHALPTQELRLNRPIYRPEESGGANPEHAERVVRETLEAQAANVGDGVTTEVVVRAAANPAQAIADEATRVSAGLVVIAKASHRVMAEQLFGNVNEHVSRRSLVPVLHAAVGQKSTIRTIVAPIGFGKRSVAVLELARDLARDAGATVHVIHVLPTDESFYRFRRATYGFGPDEPIRMVAAEKCARANLEVFAREHLEGIPYEVHTHVSADPTGTGIEFERELDVDLFVMATQGNRGFFRLVLGSAAERTLREVKCSVVTLRRPDYD